MPNWEVSSVYKNNTCLVFWLVGESLRNNKLLDEARDYFVHSFKYNPYTWSSLQTLCEIGYSVPLKDLYVASNFPVFCNEACFMSVTCSMHQCNPEDNMEVQQ